MGNKISTRWGTALAVATILALGWTRCNDLPGGPTESDLRDEARTEDAAPVACFTTEPSPPEVSAGEPIVLDAGCSVNVSSEESFHWDLGDGRTATGRRVEANFPRSGEYTVTLRVDALGRTSETTTQIRVRSRPKACFRYQQVFGDDPVPCTVDFDATCSLGEVTEYQWFFEGGPRPDLPLPDTRINTNEPYITYSWGRDEECFSFRPFDRIVRLTVVDANGATDVHEEVVVFSTPILRDPP